MPPGRPAAMGDFSTAWLHLREPVDCRSRNPSVATGLRAAFQARPRVTVVDIGCGTGANLRATAPLLGSAQDWVLLDNDAALLDAAREALGPWADAADPVPEGLALRKDDKTIVVRFRLCNLATDLDGSWVDGADLVTASAFFDLVSPAFIDRLVSAVVRSNAAFHTVLTYDGTHQWSPGSVLDGVIGHAFNAHQTADKGFGPAAGPAASPLLRRAFRSAGYTTLAGDSPWRLGPDDQALMEQLLDGIAAAVADTGQVPADAIAAWRGIRRHATRVGHEDLLALPPMDGPSG